MIHPRLIYCDGKNKILAKIAIQNRFEYGIRYPSTEILDYKISFIDVNWKKPERERYIQGVISGDQSGQEFYVILDANPTSVDSTLSNFADYLLPDDDESLSIYVDSGHWEDFMENEGV